jgi:4-hydroxybenzoate polyprenyltransferase
MRYIRFVSNLLRTREWVLSRGLFNLSIVLCFMIINDINVIKEAQVLIPIILYIISVGSLGYLINDVFDIKADDITGRLNHTLFLSPAIKSFIISILLMLAIFPFLFLLQISKYYLLLVGIQIMLFALYSMPVIRLKESMVGIFCDALYSYLLPGMIVVSIIVVNLNIDIEYSIELLLFFVWLFLIGLRSIINHQINDIGNDLKARQKTFVVRMGVEKSLFILKSSVIVEVIIFISMMVLLKALYPVIIISLIVLLITLIASFSVYTSRKLRNPGSIFEALNRYYDYCVFMGILLYFGWRYHPLFVIIPLIYVSVKLDLFSWLYYKPILWFYYKVKGAIRRIIQ